MRNNVVIKKDDYEIYKIPISFFNLFSKRKENYLWEELEKRHPCFSDDFCYSSRNYFSKKGLFSDVVVIEKSKLSEYKNKISFSGKLSLEGFENRKVFKNKKIKFVYVIVTSIFCIFVLLVLKLLVFSKIKVSNEKQINKEIFLEENKQKMRNYDFFDKNILGNIFDIARKNEGNITSLRWNLNCAGENIVCATENIYPEQLESVFPELEIPVVKYINKKPAIDFSFINKFLLNENISTNGHINSDIKTEIRTFLKNKNMVFLEETTEPYGIIVEGFMNRNPDDNLLLELGNLLSKLKLYIISIAVNPLESTGEKQKFNICITLSNCDFYKNNILTILGKNIDLFFNQSVQKFVLAKNNNNYVVQEKTSGNISNLLPIDGIKVGEIVYRSGRKVVFYKTNNGKIHKKEFYGENCL